jgi:hypothetical protein
MDKYKDNLEDILKHTHGSPFSLGLADITDEAKILLKKTKKRIEAIQEVIDRHAARLESVNLAHEYKSQEEVRKEVRDKVVNIEDMLILRHNLLGLITILDLHFFAYHETEAELVLRSKLPMCNETQTTAQIKDKVLMDLLNPPCGNLSLVKHWTSENRNELYETMKVLYRITGGIVEEDVRESMDTSPATQERESSDNDDDLMFETMMKIAKESGIITSHQQCSDGEVVECKTQ